MLPAPHVVSSRKFTDGPGACRLSFERLLAATISRSSGENNNTSNNTNPLKVAVSVMLLELVSILRCLKMGRTLSKLRVSPTQVDSSGISAVSPAPKACSPNCVDCCKKSAQEHSVGSEALRDATYSLCFKRCSCPGRSNLPFREPRFGKSARCNSGSARR